MILADTETYWSVVTNPAHIGAEITWSIILDLLLIQPIRWAIRRHDRVAHPEPQATVSAHLMGEKVTR